MKPEKLDFDILVIGGGINGAGIARDAAGRGLSVALCERDDLAQHTSSSSTKLIHGGLRYLEQFEFRLVRESLIEREVLLNAAPHIVWPLRFCLPYEKGLRPAWLLRAGLALYDHIGGRKKLPATKRVNLKAQPYANTLKDRFSFGFEYSDCWVDDARLVSLNILDASERGARIFARTSCVDLERDGDRWRATLSAQDGIQFDIRAKAVVNTAGPWVEDVLRTAHPGWNGASVRLIKGSHIVTPKLYEGDHCFIFQNADNRIIFAIPYEKHFTLIGTTDISFSGDPKNVEISEEEVSYLCSAASEYFRFEITAEDIKWTYSGVRPLYDDSSATNSTITRDYVFNIDAPDSQPPILSVFGGKITTYRKLAEHALERLSDHVPLPKAGWTQDAPLPGGDIPDADFDAYLLALRADYPWLPTPMLDRLARSYGTRITDVLGSARCIADLGVDFGNGLFQAEIEYLCSHEFAQTAEDILWRRTKLGLHLRDAKQRDLDFWLSQRAAA